MSHARADLLTLLADPERVRDVAPDAIPALIGEAAALQAQLWARLQSPPAPMQSATGSGEPDRLLTAADAAARLSVDRRWMYRHADDLPFTVRLTSGTLRFSERGLERWQRNRR